MINLQRTLFIFFVIFTLQACRTGKVRTSPTGARPPIGVPQHPPTIDDEPDPVMPVAPPPVKKVAVILGPGGAKAFAHVGVLKAFQQQRIPIEKVVGLEWGALMGGMFSLKGQTHDVEWKLYKMEQNNPLEPKGFFKSSSAERSVNVLDGFLDGAFGKEEIGRGKVPFACPTRSIWTGVVGWQTRGPYKENVKRCLAFPPTFRPQGTFLAGASQATEAVEMLVKEGFNVVILVNVLGSAQPVAQDNLRENVEYVILWQEIKRALAETSRLNIDTVNVDTSAFHMAQFGAKKDLILLGEQTGQKAATALISKYSF